MAGTADREVMTSEVLLRRARQLRAAAADLEAMAGLRDPALASPPDWAAVLHGDWAAQRVNADTIASSRRASRTDLATAATTVSITAALRGDETAASAAAVRAESIAPESEVIAVGVALTRAIIWLHRGEVVVAADAMIDLLNQVDRSAEASAVVGLLAECAFRSHQEAKARSILGSHHIAVEGAAAEEARLSAAILDTQPGDAMLELLSSGDLASPFARARLHLILGMWFRRHHRPTESRRHVQISLDHFSTIGAEPWIGPARNELRATGMRQPGAGDQSLSDQQLLIATMAARGLTNPEIAEKLFLSPRTVSSHLYRIFPKLGITSRGQLGTGLANRTMGPGARSKQDEEQ